MNKPEILIHWTGKDICANIEQLTCVDVDNYIVRLKSTINTGFWMNVNQEPIDVGGEPIKSAMTCFTDIGERNCQEHVKQYGLLGIGVSRNFVIERTGMPVWYCFNDEKDIFKVNTGNLIKFFQELKNQKTIIEELVKLNKGINSETIKDLHDQLLLLLEFAKPVPKKCIGGYHLSLLEEGEWRIAWNTKLDDKEKNNRNKGIIKDAENVDTSKTKYFLPIKKEDIELLVFPNETVLQKAMEDQEITTWFKGDFPNIITLDKLPSY